MNKEELLSKRRQIAAIERLLTKEERQELKEINKQLDIIDGTYEEDNLPELTEEQILEQNRIVEKIVKEIRTIKQVINEVYTESDIRNIYFNHDGGFSNVKYQLEYEVKNINDLSEFLSETYWYKSSLLHTKFINLFIEKFLKIDPDFDSEQFFINCNLSTDEYGKVITNYIRL